MERPELGFFDFANILIEVKKCADGSVESDIIEEDELGKKSEFVKWEDAMVEYDKY